MTRQEFLALSELRVSLRGTGLFAFEKAGTFFLYREADAGRNIKVLTSKSIGDFVRLAKKAMTK